MANHQDKYQHSLDSAMFMMEDMPTLEPTSALKQAGSDNGIPEGEEMGKFVDWAYKQIITEA